MFFFYNQVCFGWVGMIAIEGPSRESSFHQDLRLLHEAAPVASSAYQACLMGSAFCTLNFTSICDKQADRMTICVDEHLCKGGAQHTDVMKGGFPIDRVESNFHNNYPLPFVSLEYPCVKKCVVTN